MSTAHRGNRVGASGRLGIKARLWLLMIFSLATSGLLVANTQFSIGVGAETASRVFVAKDVTADILPPPMYVVGTRLLISQALEGTITIGEALSDYDRQRNEYDERVRHWSRTDAAGLEQRLLGAQHDSAVAFLDAARNRILRPIRDGEAETARAALEDVHRLFLEHRREVDRTVSASLKYADEEAARFESSLATMTWINAALLGATAIARALAFWWVIRVIWSRVGAEPEVLAEVARAVAEGDLTRGITTDKADSVAASLESMRERLRALVSVADESAREVVNAASEIAMGNNDLSERTQELASHVQSFRENLEQLMQSIRGESQVAHEADELARTASGVSKAGGDIVGQVVERMNDISGSSDRIGEIISVINSIAFQTNILALNAAVEAARAGEQGRGFAVVATEVRALAGRSSKASQEIAQLINESTSNVQGGRDLVGRAGETMHEIVLEFERVSSLVSRITSATESQTGEIDSMSASMTAIDEMNQQNAALVEEAAAASSSLREQAERLVESVGVFRY